MRPEDCRALVDLLLKDRFLLVNLARHVDVLRPLAWEHEDRLWILSFDKGCLHQRRVALCKGVGRLLAVAAYQHTAVIEGLSADLQRVGFIGFWNRRCAQPLARDRKECDE